jgi:hypothetical protein
VAIRYVLIMFTTCFTLYPLMLGILGVLIMGGPAIAVAGFVATIPVSMVRRDISCSPTECCKGGTLLCWLQCHPCIHVGMSVQVMWQNALTLTLTLRRCRC